MWAGRRDDINAPMWLAQALKLRTSNSGGVWFESHGDHGVCYVFFLVVPEAGYDSFLTYIFQFSVLNNVFVSSETVSWNSQQ